jgi:hypothetical protein
MPNRRPVRRLSCAVSLVALVAGCQALHRYRPVIIETRDAETQKPIAGASVHVSYPASNPDLAPWDSTGTTREDGRVELRAAPYGDLGIRVEASADGYLYEQKSLASDAVEAIEPASFFGKAEPRPVNLVVEMFAGPSPTVELVVPTGYHGPIRAEVQIRDDAACPPGQRCFSYPVSPSGAVVVTGRPLLRRVVAPDYHARYADGTPLNREAPDGEVRFTWAHAEGRYQYFFVGTRLEFDNFRRGVPNEPVKR